MLKDDGVTYHQYVSERHTYLSITASIRLFTVLIRGILSWIYSEGWDTSKRLQNVLNQQHQVQRSLGEGSNSGIKCR